MQKIYNVMTDDPYQNIEAALRYVLDSNGQISPEKMCVIHEYVRSQCGQWAEQSDKRLNEQDVVFGLIRANVIVQRKDNGVQPISVRYAVEHRARIPLVCYGVHADDNEAVCRMRFLTDMLFDKDNQPIYDNQGAFLVNLLGGIMVDNRHTNQKVEDVSKIILDSVYRLPEEDKQKALIGCTPVYWTKNMKQYFSQKQNAEQSEGTQPQTVVKNSYPVRMQYPQLGR